MFKWTVAILFVVSIAVASAAYAAEEGKAPPKRGEGFSAEGIFKQLDKDPTDNKLSEKEWLASPFAKRDQDRAKKSFADADTNKDSSLTLEELKAHFEKRRAERAKDGDRKPGGRRPGGKPGGKPAPAKT